mmetsp:Transcript_10749/g.31884  ORF Transcript_10749/g.31884 Transcript_10749/m.31884 type:complete len:218 (+) Transcript_10749:270-923(+)
MKVADFRSAAASEAGVENKSARAVASRTPPGNRPSSLRSRRRSFGTSHQKRRTPENMTNYASYMAARAAERAAAAEDAARADAPTAHRGGGVRTRPPLADVTKSKGNASVERARGRAAPPAPKPASTTPPRQPVPAPVATSPAARARARAGTPSLRARADAAQLRTPRSASAPTSSDFAPTAGRVSGQPRRFHRAGRCLQGPCRAGQGCRASIILMG